MTIRVIAAPPARWGYDECVVVRAATAVNGGTCAVLRHARVSARAVMHCSGDGARHSHADRQSDQNHQHKDDGYTTIAARIPSWTGSAGTLLKTVFNTADGRDWMAITGRWLPSDLRLCPDRALRMTGTRNHHHRARSTGEGRTGIEGSTASLISNPILRP